MAIAGSLELQLYADVARLRQDMEKATGIVSSGANAMARAASVATAALGALGVGLSVGALVNFSRQINNSVDALNDLSDATGASVENISALDRVARRNGTSWETVGQSLVKYNQALGSTIKPGGDAEKVLNAIGLNAKALRDLDPAEALRLTAVALSQFADDGNKARAVQELFGKSLKEVAPFLKDLAESGELVASVTKQQALEAEKFNKELFKMQTALTDAGRAIANPMVTGMNALIEQFRQSSKEGDGFIVTLLKQTEIARLLGMSGKGNGYSDVRKELELLDASLKKGNLTFQQRAMAMERQAELNKRMAGYLNSTAGAGRGVSGYGDLPKGSLTLPSEVDKKAMEVDKKAMAAAKKELEDQAKLLAELSGLSGSFAEDWARLNAIFGKGAITLEQLTAAQANLLAQQPAMKKQATEQEAAEKAALAIAQARQKARQEESDGIAQFQQQQDANLKSANELVKQAQFELSLIGLSNVEREKAIALRQLEATGIDKASLKYAELAEAIGKTITDRAAMQKQIDDFQNVWNSIDRTAQQTFTNIFEGGQDAFTKLRDTLKATLLDLLYQMTVRKWVFNLAANVTGASSTAAGAVGQATGINSLSSLGGLGNLAGGGMSMANSLGTSFANITGGGLDALLATNGAFGTAGGTAGGLMSGIGAAAPWVAGALAIASLLDKPGGGPKTIGGEANAATIQATVQATLAEFGIRNAGLRVGGFSAADPQGDSLTQLQTALFQGDRALYSRQDRVGNYENVGRSSEELAAAWAEEQSRIMLAALQATLEPKYQQYLREVDANTSGADTINAALTRLTTARALEERLLELSSTDAENLARARQRELDAMDATLRPLLEQIYAQEDLRNAVTQTTSTLADMRQAARDYATEMEDNALSALGRAIEAERNLRQAARDAASESVSSLRALFDLLGNSASDLYGQTAATRRAAGANGSAFIAQALATAQRTGYLPDSGQLSEAISAAQGGINGAQFRTVKEREFAQLVLAGQLSQLKTISGDQLTEAERTLQTAEDQLRVLEQTYDTARMQLDATRGVSGAVLTVAQALAAFQVAVQGAGNVRGAAGAGNLSNAEIAAWVAPRLGVSEASNRAIYNDALANRDRGVTLAKIDAAGGLPPGTSAAWAIANGLTPFAVGTNYVPQDMPAFLHQGEAVVPRAYNPAAGGQAMKTDRLEKLVEDLTREVQRLTVQARRTADATNGSAERPQLVQVV